MGAFWNFLAEHLLQTLIMSMRKTTLAPRETFAFCSHGEKLPRQGGLPGVQRATRLSKLPLGNEKLMWTVTDVRLCTEAKLTPGPVSCPGAMSCPGIMWTGPKCHHTKVVQIIKCTCTVFTDNFRNISTKSLFTWTRDSELPRGNDCPRASFTSRSHDDLLSRGNVAPGQLHCPGASSRSSDYYEMIWIPLVITQIVTENEF